MNTESIMKAARSVERQLIKRSPEILTAIGISGFIFSAVTAVKSTPKAMRIIDQKEIDENRRLTKGEIVKATWRCYAGPVLTGTLSTGCIIGANRIGAKRHAAIMAAYTLSETALKEYQEKAVEVVGKKKEQEIRDAVAKEKLAQNPLSSTKEVLVTGKGETLCYEPLSGRYFVSDIEDIRKAVNDLNREMRDSMYISLNEFFDALDIRHTDLGDSLGWNIEKGYIDLDFSTQLADDSRPCLVIGHHNPPFYGFDRGC